MVKPTTSHLNDENIQENSCTPVVFQSVVRIRPLAKKERDEPIALEPTSSTCVTLHPPPARADSLPPSSALVLQTLSPDEMKLSRAIEFNVDTVLPAETSQEKAYDSIGRGMALASMEPLKAFVQEPGPTQTSLLITMGLSNSGKSHTCWSESTISKRRTNEDGFLPRLVSSLFSQSTHHLPKGGDCYFAINMTILQIDQNIVSKECKMHDLLQPLNRTLTIMSPTLREISARRKVCGEISSACSVNTSFGSYTSIDEPVTVEQDLTSSECLLVNGQVRTCTTEEEARLCLNNAINTHSRRKRKKVDSHIFVQIVPVLLDRKGQKIMEGGRIAVLDMAGLVSQTSASKKKPRSGRIKDELPNRLDAYTAVLHCLRTIQSNQEAKMAGNKKHTMVPFLQHKVTMTLQPLFSAKNSDYTHVVLFLAASPAPRDYPENKELLQEIQSLRRVPPTRGAITGIENDLQMLRMNIPRKAQNPKASRGSVASRETNRRESCEKSVVCRSKADIKSVPPKIIRNQTAEFVHADTFDIDNILVPLPPPVAPSYNPQLEQKSLWEAQATAPPEDPSSLSPFNNFGLRTVSTSSCSGRSDLSGESTHFAVGAAGEAKLPSPAPIVDQKHYVTHQITNKSYESRLVQLEDRLRILEAKNADLECENAILREKTKALEQENEDLKNGTGRQRTVTSTTTSFFEDDETRTDLFVNPLFEHMANMNKGTLNF